MANNLSARIARVDVIIGGVDQAKKRLDEMKAAAAQLAKEVERARTAMVDNTGMKEYDKYKGEYDNLLKQQKLTERAIRDTRSNINTVENVLSDISGQTLRNLQNSQRVMRQALLGIDPEDVEGLETVRGFITEIADEIKRRKGDLMEFKDVIGDIGNVSEKSLGMAAERLKQLIQSTKLNADEMETYREQLRKVEQEQERRASADAGRVMGNLGGSSLSEIQQAIKMTTSLRDAQKLGGDEWEIYNEEIQRAQKYLSDFNELGQRMTMVERMKNLSSASTSALEELRKFWQEQVNGAQKGSSELAEYEKLLKQVMKEQSARTEEKALNVVGNLEGSSLDEIQQAVKTMQQLRDAQALGSTEWERYNESVQKAQKYLSDFNEEQRRTSMENRMADLGKASTASLEELRKFWKEQVDGAEYASGELKKYTDQLNLVEKEMSRRTANRAEKTIADVQAGSYSGTIAEMKEAIKLLEQYKQQLNTSDTTGLKETEAAVRELNRQIKEAEGAVMSYREAMRIGEAVESGNFNGTIEDLQKARKSLEEFKKSLSVSDTKGMKRVEDTIAAVDRKIKEAETGTRDFSHTLKNLKSASLHELEEAAEQLQKQLNLAKRGQEDYIKKASDLRKVNNQIKRVKREWKAHDSQIKQTVKRLASYVLVYTGFNEVVGRVKQIVNANLELSDSLADIQKTTGMSAESVAELSREIDSIDTRTSQAELNALAYEAGKLGLSAKEDVLGFVRAGNELMVALGEDLGGAEAVRELMKVNAILGETEIMGVEKALKATGSAINEISQTSRADAAPIVEIVSRIGAIGNAAGLSMPELIALGGTIDALAQNVEVGATAMNKFMSVLLSDTTQVARAVGLNDEYLKGLINSGRTMEAIIAVFEKLNAIGGLDVLSPLMKDLGSDGDRLKTVLVTLSAGVDELKSQVFTSTRAFSEATSVTNEYNIKNESAMAIMMRMGNAIRESLVNSGFVEWLTDVLRWMSSIPKQFERGEWRIKTFAVVLQMAIGLMIAMSKATKQASQTMMTFSTVTKNAFKSNPLGWVALAITTATSALTAFHSSVNHAENALEDFNSALQKERFELNNLKFAIDKANDSNGEKAALIQELNRKYGAYLGFLVTENNYLENQEYIYKLINARLQETLALKMKDRMMDNVTDKYADQIHDLQSDILKALNQIKNVGETNAVDAMSYIMEGINEAVEKGKGPYVALQKFMQRYSQKSVSRGLYNDVSDLLVVMRNVNAEMETAQKILDGSSRTAKRETDRLMRDELERSGTNVAASENAGELNTYLQKANTYMERLKGSVDELNAKRERGEKLSAEETKELKEKSEQMETYKKRIEEAQGKVKSLGLATPWGQGLDLETAGVDKLVATYEKLESAMKSINEDKDYAGAFASRGFKSAQEEYQALKKMEEDVARVLEEKWNRDTGGNWIREPKSRGKSYSYGGAVKTEREIKEESTAALSALEAYFNMEKTLIARAYLDEEITEEEKNARMLKKEEEFLHDRVALRKKLLGMEGGEKFDESKYVHTDDVSGETVDYFGGKNIEQLSGFVRQMGQAMTDGMLNQLTQDELKIREMAIERMKRIQQIILDNDFTGQVDKQYQDELEALKLFWGETENVTQEGSDKRLEALKKLSRDSYSMDAKELKERMAGQEEFAEWMEGRTEEEYMALLLMLQKFYDDTEEADNREMERRQKITDKLWDKTGRKSGWAEKEEKAETNVSFMNDMSSIGLATESMVDDAELALYRTRLEAAKEYYEFVLANGGNLEEAERKRTEAMEELSRKEVEVTKSKLETLKGYTDAIVDFSEQMGEAAFGEVEDRKEAARQLLQTVMKLTKDLIMQKVTELIMKKALGQQEVAQEAATQSTVTAIHGQQAMTDLNVQMSKTETKVTQGTAEAAATTVGELGWWGIPLIAVISAALSALMGMAMSKFTKAKSEIAAETGTSKSRVAAGMLTYAEGDYPVLGNDGRIYNARYQKELKTGVYSGGAHFGIFSEKKPEMIVDGDTTQKLVLNYPQIYESILTIARNGRLKSAAMPVFAEGSYPAMQIQTQAAGVTTDAGGSGRLEQTLMGLQQTVAKLSERLDKPISATVDPYGKNGAVTQLDKASRFMKKRGLA